MRGRSTWAALSYLRTRYITVERADNLCIPCQIKLIERRRRNLIEVIPI